MSQRIQAITMPKWGMTMTEGTVAAWLVEEGAPVAVNDEVVEIETTKITNVFESPAPGVLRRRLVDVGQAAPVGALLGIVADDAVPDAEIDAFVEKFQTDYAALAESEAGGPSSETIEAGERRLRYLRLGEADELPLVLLHGYGGDLNNWMFNQPILAETRAVYALDLPGHGGSTKDVDGGSVEAISAGVLEFLDAAGIDRAHLAGHSLGGACALSVALERPDRAASLTLICPAGLGPEINMDYVQGFIDAERRKQMKPVLELVYADGSLVSRDMINDVLKYKRLDGVDGVLRAIAGTAFADGKQQLVLADRLAALQMPAQIIWGQDDRILPPSQADGLPESISVHRIPAAGHMVHMEEAGEVNRLIASFIAG